MQQLQVSTLCFPPPFNITSKDNTFLVAFIHLLYRVEELTKFIQSNYVAIRNQYKELALQQLIDLIFIIGKKPIKDLMFHFDEIKKMYASYNGIIDSFVESMMHQFTEVCLNNEVSIPHSEWDKLPDPRRYFDVGINHTIHKYNHNLDIPEKCCAILIKLMADITEDIEGEITRLFNRIKNREYEDMTIKQREYFYTLDADSITELTTSLQNFVDINYNGVLTYSTVSKFIDSKRGIFVSVQRESIDVHNDTFDYSNNLYTLVPNKCFIDENKNPVKKPIDKEITLSQIEYELVGFVTHSGATLSNGRYNAYGLYGEKCDELKVLTPEEYNEQKNRDTKWYKFDSRKTNPINFDPTEILNGTNQTDEVPVILLYRIKDMYVRATLKQIPDTLRKYVYSKKEREFDFIHNDLYKTSDVEMFDKLYQYMYIYTKPDNFPLLAKPPVKLLNDNIDVLLSNLSPAHLIHLNKSMLLIKLHRNPVFHQWLQLVDISILYKFYHNTQNRYYCDKYQFDNQHVSPQFITLCVIPESEQHNINLMCCGVDINKTNLFSIDPSEISSDKNHDGEDIDKSGIIVNGGYFMLPLHVDNKEFGIDNPYSRYAPIGNYHSIYTVIEPSGFYGKNDYSIVEHPYNYTLKETIAEINPENKQLTLQIVDDTNGILIIDPINRAEIISIQQFREMKGDYTDRHQYVSGNLLVHNSELVMVEELMIVVYNLIAYEGDYQLPFLTKCYVCDMDGNPVRVEQIYELSIGDPIRITQNGIQIYQSEYRTENLFFPYNVHLFNSQYGNAMNGKIPPGIPVHASDLNPRTCIFKDISNNLFVMHVEGRNNYVGGKGIDLFDLAKLCKKMGAVSAINLDGGNSSKIIWKEQGMSLDYMGLEDCVIGNGIVITPIGQ